MKSSGLRPRSCKAAGLQSLDFCLINQFKPDSTRVEFGLLEVGKHKSLTDCSPQDPGLSLLLSF